MQTILFLNLRIHNRLLFQIFKSFHWSNNFFASESNRILVADHTLISLTNLSLRFLNWISQTALKNTVSNIRPRILLILMLLTFLSFNYSWLTLVSETLRECSFLEEGVCSIGRWSFIYLLLRNGSYWNNIFCLTLHRFHHYLFFLSQSIRRFTLKNTFASYFCGGSFRSRNTLFLNPLVLFSLFKFF